MVELRFLFEVRLTNLSRSRKGRDIVSALSGAQRHLSRDPAHL
jgi:hypothetical protein